MSSPLPPHYTAKKLRPPRWGTDYSQCQLRDQDSGFWILKSMPGPLEPTEVMRCRNLHEGRRGQQPQWLVPASEDQPPCTRVCPSLLPPPPDGSKSLPVYHCFPVIECLKNELMKKSRNGAHKQDSPQQQRSPEKVIRPRDLIFSEERRRPRNQALVVDNTVNLKFKSSCKEEKMS